MKEVEKMSRWGIVSACIMALALACGDASEPDTETDQAASKVKEESREAMEAVGEYASAQRTALQNRAQRALDEMEKSIEKARSEVAEVPEQARAQVESAIEQARQARSELDQEIEKLKKEGAAGWETSSQRISAALSEVEEARREIASALQGAAATEPTAEEGESS